MVTPESARTVMETYNRRRSVGRPNEPVDLPLTNQAISQIAEIKTRPRRNEQLKTQAKDLGLAIIGGGRVGLFRGEVAPSSGGEMDRSRREEPHRAGEVAPKDRRRLRHAEPSRAAAAAGSQMRDHRDRRTSARRADHGGRRARHSDADREAARDRPGGIRPRARSIEDDKIDAVVGYTQRFRRRWLAAKEKVRTGALGDVTLVTSRAFMNRLVAIDNYKRTDDPSTISPMVISGTHALDMCMW